jgi:hypothetical protein
MPEHDDDIRISCAKRFATIDANVDGFKTALQQFSQTNDRVTRTEESVKGLWKELREDIMPELRQVPRDVRAALEQQRRDMTDALDKHAADCPARTKAMRRASGQNGSTSTPPPTQPVALDPALPVAQPRRSLLPVSPVTIRWLLYLGLVIGGAIAGLAAAFGIDLGLPGRTPPAAAAPAEGEAPAGIAPARPPRPTFPRLKPISD